MRKLFLIFSLVSATIATYSQAQEENGTIYIKHPNIDAVNSSMKAYVSNDMSALGNFFADTAKIWYSGMDKPMPAKDALKEFATDFDFYNNIKVDQVGYPDYLHYKDKDQKFVQSWWLWSGTSKKTGQVVKIDFVQFDQFNDDGKIISEALYGDFSKLVKEK